MPLALPPGPRPRLPISTLLAFRSDPIDFLSRAAAQYGDMVSFKVGPQTMVLLNHPDLIRDVLVTKSRSFVKGRALERTKRLLGEGLLTSSGDVHLRQRRLAQPAFHRQRVAAYGQAMVEETARICAGWRDGAVVDMAQEQMRLTLLIVGRTLFGSDTSTDVEAVYAAMGELLSLFSLTALPFAEQLEKLPLPQVRRFRAARARLDAIIYRMIAARRGGAPDQGDLLSMLLLAQDAEGDGTGMSDEQLRDEALTIFLAGHETTANALTWSLYLLSQYPAVADQLYAEVDAALGGRPPTIADLPSLREVEMLAAEALRLYPPAWILGRRAIEPYSVGGYHFPANTVFVMSQWVMHHDPRYYPDPFRFDPQRWTAAAREARPKFAYFPFGGGPRLCIGEQFAWMELVLVLTTIMQGWRAHLLPGHPVALQPSITLRPKYGMRMRLERRTMTR